MLGGMHARGRHGKGTCVAKGPAWPWGCACLGGVLPGGVHGWGVCVARGHAWQETQPLQRMVRILLECILVFERI